MSILDQFPIWTIYLLTLGLVLLAAEIGFRCGVWLQSRDPSALKGSLPGLVVAGSLGLLAFVLAFSIGLAVDHYDARSQLVIIEANAIQKSYLQAGFLEEPDRIAARELLREYVNLRLAALDPEQLKLEDAIRRSEEIHNQLWLIVEDQASKTDSLGFSSFVDSVEEVIDAHGQRLAAILSLRLSPLMWLVFFGTSLLTFFLMGIVSSADGKRNFITIFAFALAVTVVLVLIVELDRTQEGLITVSQSALRDLQRQFTMPMR